MDFYRDTDARARAMQAPQAAAPSGFDWNDWKPDEAASLPITLTRPGACSCDSPSPCCEPGPPYPWIRQTGLIGIERGDAVTDDGQEVFNLLEQTGVADVIVMGVHTNVCVLGRPYGIRQLVRLGKRRVLCADLTDSFHRDPHGHAWGTAQIAAHIERRWCPVVASDMLVGAMPSP